MSANSLLNALQSHLSGAGLTPVPKGIGVAEPTKNTELPAVVLSLDNLTIPSKGLGGHSEAVVGALRVSSEIDLADPLLPGDPEFSLLSDDRKSLTLYHGGLVDKDGLESPLSAADIQVAHNASSFTLVDGTPNSGEFAVSAPDGLLLFKDPLPVTGTITASYFVGQWERRVDQLAGQLDVDVVAGSNTDTEVLGVNVMQAMDTALENITSLRKLIPARVGPVTSFMVGTTAKRRRQLNWHFDYEQIINQAESSGGIIQRIITRTRRDNSPVEEEEIT